MSDFDKELQRILYEHITSFQAVNYEDLAEAIKQAVSAHIIGEDSGTDTPYGTRNVSDIWKNELRAEQRKESIG